MGARKHFLSRPIPWAEWMKWTWADYIRDVRLAGKVERYISYCGGVHFAASWVSESQGFLEGQGTLSGVERIFPMGLITFLPSARRGKSGHLRDSVSRFL